MVAILDADKEGFLRSHRSLTQTAGRAARNVNGMVIMYADHITQSMQLTIDETERRRLKQIHYNEEHGIRPEQIRKALKGVLRTEVADDSRHPSGNSYSLPYIEPQAGSMVADPIEQKMSKAQLEKEIADMTHRMKEAAKNLEFMQAAQYRDEIVKLQSLLDMRE